MDEASADSSQPPVSGVPSFPPPVSVDAVNSVDDPLDGSFPTPINTAIRHVRSQEQRDKEKRSVAIIQNTYLCYRNRQIFQLLVHSICAAEYSMSFEILKKVNPKEAEFLKENKIPYKVRFRFGGEVFPPLVYFKVYLNVEGNGKFAPSINYLSGKRLIRAATTAAADAAAIMGNRVFLKQVLADSCQYQQHLVTDESDVATVRDFMHFRNFLDDSPSDDGGKQNRWRKLNLEEIPRQTLFYDIMDLVLNGKKTDHLKHSLPLLLKHPTDQQQQLKQIQLVSQQFPPIPETPKTVIRPSLRKTNLVHGRRLKAHQNRVAKMRQIYETGSRRGLQTGSGQIGTGSGGDLHEIGTGNDRTKWNEEEDEAGDDEEEEEEEDDDEEEEKQEWEKEAEQLYQWTRNLSEEGI